MSVTNRDQSRPTGRFRRHRRCHSLARPLGESALPGGRRIGLLLSLAGFILSSAHAEDTPVALDPNLEVILFAADPDIVTPIGAVTNADGDLFVVESHTHVRPKDYVGPSTDLIKRFVDTDGDGRADEITIFARIEKEAMNLAFAPDGVLHVVTASDVIRLNDADGNGTSETDEHTVLLHLETQSGNPHGDLLGIAIDRDGTIYASRGNVGGYPYAYISAAHERLTGYGEGGDIVRINPDGSGLHRVATGFWNPFVIAFDRHGRLLCADNDPDSRGPNRVVHVIDGGDYGYLARYGPTGLHPFSGWNADLPGVLPIAAGTGEAPSGLLDLTSTRLGPNYSDAFAVTIWGEHTLSLFHPHRTGASFTATAEPFINGGEHFRPVALAPAKGGGFFITDWVLRDYPNHSRGAIWLVRPKQPGPEVHTAADVAALLKRIPDVFSPAQAESLLSNEDPFLRHHAVAALAAHGDLTRLEQLLASPSVDLRQGAWLALRHRGHAFTAAEIESALTDPSEVLRILALRHIGDQVDRTFTSKVEAMLTAPDLSPRLFRFVLATQQILGSDVDAAYAKGTRTFAIKRDVPAPLIERLVQDDSLPDAGRALAIPQLADPAAPAVRETLLQLITSSDSPPLVREAMRSLAAVGEPAATPIIQIVAFDPSLDPELRADAVSSLRQLPDGITPAFKKLLNDPAPPVRLEATRALQAFGLIPAADPVVRPTSLDDWNALLGTGGDPAAGERVFHETTALCITCHRVKNRGSVIGPDLSNIGLTLSRRQLIRSIIQPSDDISPEYQGWEIKLNNGGSVVGLQGHLRGWGIILTGFTGEEIRTRHENIASYGAMERSLMPDGLGQILPVDDLRNLVAYLESLR
ncbi:PVC-type heme-binding CxxCH protein [Synoicihabitans lomoniglobus]|uniref:C-type cytochrome n=1 Tax=Synoicihabitans lomoniglobus TaxID=2909285 RepID=A0AAF0I2W4_9BACT|nr:c-type cytochrome [Opitutaceae bacterium LMO-M01]WED65983.1 c-type cytochrome [Opitutaceae bacterium LMO-M01]